MREWRLWAQMFVGDFLDLLERVTVYSLIAWLTITAWTLAYQVFRWMFFTLIVTLTLQIAPGYAHDAEVRQCFNNGTIVEPRASKVHPSGLWAEVYKGTTVTVLTLSPITGYKYNWNKEGQDDLAVEHSEHPIMYWVDWDLNGRFDEAFVDKGGSGKCSEIEHYEYLNGGPELDENNPRKEAGDQWSLG